MKPKGLVFGALAVLIITAASAAVGSAQSSVQNVPPTPMLNGISNDPGGRGNPNTPSSTNPVTDTQTFTDAPADSTTTPADTQTPTSTPTDSTTTPAGTQQAANPQPNQPHGKGAKNKNNATPTGAAPSAGDNPTKPGGKGSGNATDPGGKGSGNPTNPGGGAPGGMKELPKTGGATIPMLSIVGAMLMAGGLLVRKALR